MFLRLQVAGWALPWDRWTWGREIFPNFQGLLLSMGPGKTVTRLGRNTVTSEWIHSNRGEMTLVYIVTYLFSEIYRGYYPCRSEFLTISSGPTLLWTSLFRRWGVFQLTITLSRLEWWSFHTPVFRWCLMGMLQSKPCNTVYGRNPANQLIGTLSSYLPGFIHPRWGRIFFNQQYHWGSFFSWSGQFFHGMVGVYI